MASSTLSNVCKNATVWLLFVAIAACFGVVTCEEGPMNFNNDFLQSEMNAVPRMGRRSLGYQRFRNYPLRAGFRFNGGSPMNDYFLHKRTEEKTNERGGLPSALMQTVNDYSNLKDLIQKLTKQAVEEKLAEEDFFFADE